MTLQTQWDATLIADIATGVEDLYFWEQMYTNCYKALFLPLALSVFNENYTSYKLSVRMHQDVCWGW